MKKLNKKFLALIATITTIMATTVATSACAWYLYQPEEPECLREE
ncbi:cyclic lactone autoinducer peptide [Clostridium sp. UBA4548]|nr:cyclic lactone autoinducer peptide [Clostridium sp. UBA4548]